jgi:hypothetical protein
MTTALYIITSALRTANIVGAGQAIPPESSAVALERLNDLLDSWASESLFAFGTAEYTGTGLGGTVTIGPAGDIVTPYVPIRLEGGFVRSAEMDFRFDLVGYQEYADVSLKSVVGGPYPSVGYYDGAGTLLLYPVPSNAEVHVSAYEHLSEFATLSTDYDLRPGVRRALSLSLAEELAPDYGLPLSQDTRQLAFRARRILKRSNHVTPQLGEPNRSMENLYPPGFSGENYDGVDGNV